jgi:hypothetical protein
MDFRKSDLQDEKRRTCRTNYPTSELMGRLCGLPYGRALAALTCPKSQNALVTFSDTPS